MVEISRPDSAASDDLTERYKEFRLKLSGLSSGGWVRQADLVAALCGKALGLVERGPESFRSTLGSWLDKVPELRRSAEPRPKGGKFFSIDESAVIAVAAALAKEETGRDVTSALRRAAQLLQVPRRTPQAEGLAMAVDKALDDLEQHILGTLCRILVEDAFGVAWLPIGSIVTITRTYVGAVPSAGANPDERVALAIDGGNLLFVGDDILPGTGNWLPREQEFSTDDYAYRLTLRLTRSAVEPERQGSLLSNRVATCLLNLMTSDFPRLRAEVFKQLPYTISTEQVSGAESGGLTTLWLIARLASTIFDPTGHRNTRALLLAPAADTGAGGGLLHSVVTDDRPPWSMQPTHEIAVPLGMLLSGYASILHVPLIVPTTADELGALVAFHHNESKTVGGKPISAVAVPLTRPRIGASWVLYLWGAASQQQVLDERVTLLRLGAGAMGDMIERLSKRPERTADRVRGCTSSPKDKAAFTQDVIQHIRQLLRQTSDGGSVRGQQRLVGIVLQASVVNRRAGVVRSWLARQLQLVDPYAILAAWAGADLPFSSRSAIVGALSDDTVVIFIPEWIDRDGIAALRRILSGINTARAATSESMGDVGSLRAWMVDIRRPDAPVSETELAAKLIALTEQASNTLTYVIAAHRAHVSGDWEQALTHIKEAIGATRAVTPNAFLLRRAAEFATIRGEFEAAAEYAKQATAAEPASIRARCLYGDALLCRGNLRAALAVYREAGQLDPSDPLPRVSLGYAFILTARLLVLDILAPDRRSRRSSTKDRGPSYLNEVSQIAEELAKEAMAIFQSLRAMSGIHRAADSQASDAAYGLWQVRLLLRRSADALEALRKERAAAPWDHYLQRELLLGLMWHNNVAPAMLRELHDPKTREELFAPSSDLATAHSSGTIRARSRRSRGESSRQRRKR